MSERGMLAEAVTLRQELNEARAALAREKARADAAEAERDGLLDLQRKARATVAAMYEAVREAELRPPLATYVEMRREGPDAPLQYYAMKPEKVTGFFEALRDRWNGSDVERWAKEFIEARDRVSASESALAAARRECEGLRTLLLDVKADLGYAEWGTPEHGANLLQRIIAKHHPRLSAALAAPRDGEEG